ncbi:NADH-quinone oxidoreductase subunit L [Alloacidobacterium dinghuense]|uniref:NADH-quinone oxidoreductase subunit L n=1 Tax=Alloacidobacterium dinghuense TaxID=2763107 RepID=A0A7G8BLP1_9BACT|nr:NADH-quinone oxidoreductase subunit L [Alloacidobacterium dinghuense]QNI33461.1 NADH-quinone oxidoreductase subunit L [Alloacidobacterium dinghuense]
MLHFLWLVVAIPFTSAAVLALFGSRFSRRLVAFLGAGSIGLAAVVSILISISFLSSPPPNNAYTQHLWTWMSTGGFQPEIAFYLDPVSLLMLLVVTFVSFLIHLYSAEYMHDDEGYARFFAYMNLFVASMLTLILANNLLLLYLGWEGVGLCSFLLIGFWYQDPANVRAAGKAFIVTRFGDTAFAIGLFLLFTKLGTLDIQELMHRASDQWPISTGAAIASAALLLGGAVGKSAQLPLQTWLPDAMAGPTPTSALIHAATMVTAGVYLIARTHVLFTLAPEVQLAVAIIGAATMLLAAFSALAQRDMKRVLAYSTISQIGYMFLALGLGAWSAAMFHFMTHAFFKALLFLAAGVVIHAIHEQDLFKMGGLRKELRLAFFSFIIGGCALAGLPLITAGFFSKDLILWQSWAGPNGNILFWIVGMTGALLTSLYTFRMISLAFYGRQQAHVHAHSGAPVRIALITLCVLSIVGGYVDTPPDYGGVPALSNFLNSVLPPLAIVHPGPITETITALCASTVFAIGLGLAYLFFGPQRTRVPMTGFLQELWFAGWGFDWIYDRLLVRPFLWVARQIRRDPADLPIRGLGQAAMLGNRALRLTQTGRVRWYAAGLAMGTAAILAVAFFLR